jgi:ABC-type transport system involved in cytochrome bd biosynthesis fused ATPase/permease subunit
MITVAHRMYSAQISDWVFVLEDGQIIEQGQPRDLETSGGSYQHLLESELSTNTKKV